MLPTFHLSLRVCDVLIFLFLLSEKMPTHNLLTYLLAYLLAYTHAHLLILSVSAPISSELLVKIIDYKVTRQASHTGNKYYKLSRYLRIN